MEDLELEVEVDVESEVKEPEDDQLVEDLAGEDPGTVHELRKMLKSAQRSRDRYKRKYEETLAECKLVKESLRMASLKKQKGVRFTVRGGLTMACRRAISNTSSFALGLSMAVDVHTKTVNRWEVRLRACRLAAMHHFYSQCYRTMELESPNRLGQDGSGMAPIMVAAHSLRIDATNVNIWKRKKLSSCEVDFCFLVQPIRYDDGWAQAWAGCRRKKCFQNSRQSTEARVKIHSA